MEDVIEVQNVNKFFGEEHILKDVSHTLEKGKIHALIDVFMPPVRERINSKFVKKRLNEREMQSALEEAERIAKDPSVKGYTDMDELFNDLKK